jgi:hypothetical protein
MGWGCEDAEPAGQEPDAFPPAPDADPVGEDLDALLTSLDLVKKFGHAICDEKSDKQVGIVHVVENSIKSTCNIHSDGKHKCGCWITLTAARPMHAVLADSYRWLADGRFSDKTAHLEKARELKIKYGMKPRN